MLMTMLTLIWSVLVIRLYHIVEYTHFSPIIWRLVRFAEKRKRRKNLDKPKNDKHVQLKTNGFNSENYGENIELECTSADNNVKDDNREMMITIRIDLVWLF